MLLLFEGDAKALDSPGDDLEDVVADRTHDSSMSAGLISVKSEPTLVSVALGFVFRLAGASSCPTTQ